MRSVYALIIKYVYKRLRL